MEALAEKNPRERPTQTRLAKMVGVSQPAVHEWGFPDRAPEHTAVLKLAHELNVCVEWLYTERGPKRPPPTQEVQAFLAGFNQLDDDLKKQIANYAEFLKGGGANPPRQ